MLAHITQTTQPLEKALDAVIELIATPPCAPTAVPTRG
jgi:hypothetical protein